MTIVVATRRGPEDAFLTAMRPDVTIDLDDDRYFEIADLTEYVRRRLLCIGEPNGDTPYRERPLRAAEVAAAVAKES